MIRTKNTKNNKDYTMKTGWSAKWTKQQIGSGLNSMKIHNDYSIIYLNLLQISDLFCSISSLAAFALFMGPFLSKALWISNLNAGGHSTTAASCVYAILLQVLNLALNNTDNRVVKLCDCSTVLLLSCLFWITCYIFISSIAKIASPFFNLVPSFTSIFEIIPGMRLIALWAASISFTASLDDLIWFFYYVKKKLVIIKITAIIIPIVNFL